MKEKFVRFFVIKINALCLPLTKNKLSFGPSLKTSIFISLNYAKLYLCTRKCLSEMCEVFSEFFSDFIRDIKQSKVFREVISDIFSKIFGLGPYW